ncbi:MULTISPECIES: hypothetical protein [Flavobacterium]|uniref:Uncharacterized protein n=1 Tax=Flavobacterium stagni TaxID=2506421 RepID=A0A4Q1K9V7_9FLAO|nr:MULTISPECIES: hypothetical protein [Flavobacterium]RXR22882.1 hypothetical protein EQG61_06525 [Flavobacterium stagni]
MKKKYIPSLIISSKATLILFLGIVFNFTNQPESMIMFGIAGFLYCVALIVFFIMNSLNKDGKETSIF